MERNLKTQTKMKVNQNQNGSVFFYILLAVVLFAALAFTVSRSIRGSGSSTLTERQAEIAASEIMDYSAQISREVDRIRRNNISETDIDFFSEKFLKHTSNPSLWNQNPNCSSDECRVFHSAGGKMHETIFENYATPLSLPFSSSYPKGGHPSFHRVSVETAGTDAEDLIMNIVSIKQEVCEKINEKLGVPAPYDMNREQWLSFGSTAWGAISNGYWNFNETKSSQPLFEEATEMQGQTHGCYDVADYGITYYRMLIER